MKQNTVVDSKGRRIKILKLQLGFLCDVCKAAVPVRNLLAKKTQCPQCKTQQSLTGKFAVPKLLSLGNPAIHAIDAGLADRTETSGFFWIQLNVAPSGGKCPRCNQLLEIETVFSGDSYECSSCKGFFDVTRQIEFQGAPLHPLLDCIITEIIPIHNDREVSVLTCVRCGASLEIRSHSRGRIKCSYCGTFHLVPDVRPEAVDFKRPRILLIVDVSVEKIIEQIKTVEGKKLPRVRYDLFLNHIDYNHNERKILEDLGLLPPGNKS